MFACPQPAALSDRSHGLVALDRFHHRLRRVSFDRRVLGSYDFILHSAAHTADTPHTDATPLPHSPQILPTFIPTLPYRASLVLLHRRLLAVSCPRLGPCHYLPSTLPPFALHATACNTSAGCCGLLISMPSYARLFTLPGGSFAQPTSAPSTCRHHTRCGSAIPPHQGTQPRLPVWNVFHTSPALPRPACRAAASAISHAVCHCPVELPGGPHEGIAGVLGTACDH